MNHHQSPHQPSNSDLTALRRRQARKEGNAMKRTIAQGIIGVAMLGTAIAGIALVDASGPEKVTTQGYANPVPCVETVEQVLVCGSPVASPVPLPTIAPTVAPEPTPTLTAREEVETITELPGTGTGPDR
jgi:hypothetical protein